MKDHNLLNHVGAIVAVGLLLMVGTTTVLVHLYPIPKENEIIIGQIQGSVWTAFMMVVSFLFGTSMGRTKQDDTINRLASAQPAAPLTKTTTSTTTIESEENTNVND